MNYKQALALSKEIGHKQNEGMLLNSIGGTYLFMGEYSKALDFYRQALKVSNEQRIKAQNLKLYFNGTFILSTKRLSECHRLL